MSDPANGPIWSPVERRDARSPSEGARARVRALSALLLFEVSLLAFVVARDPLLASRVRAAILRPRRAPAVDHASRFRDDPAPGTPLPADATGAAVRRAAAPARAGYLLVPIGDCASCLKADLAGWQRQCAARGLSLILLTSAPEAAARRYLRRLGVTAPCVTDPDGWLERRLNALWAGRSYLYSPAWKLRCAARGTPGDSPFTDRGFLAALTEGARCKEAAPSP
ncbi:MAG: hypothetical protein IT208_10735 [Chthonomonadales bacterium]|nr:hypothetical protein [Chthonomonadales bacterium]